MKIVVFILKHITNVGYILLLITLKLIYNKGKFSRNKICIEGVNYHSKCYSRLSNAISRKCLQTFSIEQHIYTNQKR